VKALSWVAKFCRHCDGERPHDKRRLTCHDCGATYNPWGDAIEADEAREPAPPAPVNGELWTPEQEEVA
jgi:hypothetical protein